MLAKSKRLLAPILALMIVLSTIAVPASAEAATKPSATYYGSTKRYVKRGKTLKFQFLLRSNSYSRLSYGAYNGWRASFDTDIFKKSTGERVAYTNYEYFTGNISYTVSGKFSKANGYKKNAWYKMRYRTRYRKSPYAEKWHTVKSKWIQIRVQ